MRGGDAPIYPSAPDRQARLDAMRVDLEGRLAAFRESLGTDAGQGKPVLRDLTTAAHEMLALGHPAADAERLMERAFGEQSMDADAADFGNVPWQAGHPEIKDANAIEFTVKPLCGIFLRYGKKLSPAFVASARPHLAAAAAAVRRHRVGFGYTNIYLMKMNNLHLLGLILGDSALAEEGAAGFRAWIAYTHDHGLSEYSSPTYANTQLSCLLSTYRFTTDNVLKGQIKAALDYLWTDLGASTFLAKSGGAQLAGPFSRNYDFPCGSGPLDRPLYVAGLREVGPSHTLFVDYADPLINAMEGGYEPAGEILDIARLPERVVHARFGKKAGQDRTVYLTRDLRSGVRRRTAANRIGSCRFHWPGAEAGGRRRG